MKKRELEWETSWRINQRYRKWREFCQFGLFYKKVLHVIDSQVQHLKLCLTASGLVWLHLWSAWGLKSSVCLVCVCDVHGVESTVCLHSKAAPLQLSRLRALRPCLAPYPTKSPPRLPIPDPSQSPPTHTHTQTDLSTSFYQHNADCYEKSRELYESVWDDRLIDHIHIHEASILTRLKLKHAFNVFQCICILFCTFLV